MNSTKQFVQHIPRLMVRNVFFVLCSEAFHHDVADKFPRCQSALETVMQLFVAQWTVSITFYGTYLCEKIWSWIREEDEQSICSQPVCSVAKLTALTYFARCHCDAYLQVSAAVTLPQFKIFEFKNGEQILRKHNDFQERFAWCISKVIFQLGWEMSCQVLSLL